MRVAPAVTWRAVDASELPELASLATNVLRSDGGFPLAAEPAFLAGRYAGDGVTTLGGWRDGRLVAAASVRPVTSAGVLRPVATAIVDPDCRGRGLGAYVLDWALATAGTVAAAGGGAVTVETESLTEAAVALFASRGLRQTFAEDVMRFDLSRALPVVPLPAGVTVVPWTPELAGRFFAVYEAAFRQRPGFPGWPAAQWVEWISGGDDFRPEWSLLATDADAGRDDGAGRAVRDVGFVACATGWIAQVGVRPEQRGRGLGAALIVQALGRMRDGGGSEALLDVNIDNPAGRLYERLGFTVLGRRARFANERAG